MLPHSLPFASHSSHHCLQIDLWAVSINQFMLHIPNISSATCQSVCSDRTPPPPLCGSNCGFGSAGSSNQSKGVNLKWFKHWGGGGSKLHFPTNFHKWNPVLVRNSYMQIWERRNCWRWEGGVCLCFASFFPNNVLIRFEKSNWVQAD